MLNKLPREVLDSILQYHACTCSLWMCGDRVLQSRLCSTVTNLPLTRFSGNTFVFPEWLLQLSNLKSVALVSTDILVGNSPRWLDVLKSLPSSLESLTIDSKDSMEAFTDWDSAKGLSCYVSYVEIATYFPNLTSLTLKGYEPHYLRNEFLSALPPTLTSLVLGITHFTPPFFELLPRSLLYFEYNLLGVNSNLQEHLDDYANMPPKMVIAYPKISVSTLNPAQLQKLPHLTSMKVSRLTSEMIPHLPRGLVKLDLGMVSTQLGAQVADSALTLPLNGENADASSAPTLAWPPALQELILSLESCAPDSLASLPRSLQRLHLTIVPPGTLLNFHIDADSLPPTLQDLTLITPTGYHQFFIDGHFPATLKQLSSSAQRTIVPSNLSAALPPSISSLQLAVAQVPLKTPPNSGYTFPPHLTTLSVNTWASAWMPEIPRTVTSLTIVELNHSLHLPNFDLIARLHAATPNLTNLNMEMFSLKMPLTANYKAGQLPHLLHLTLPKSLKITSSSIKNLPRTLQTLAVTVEGIATGNFPKLKYLAFLPPNLERCEVFRALRVNPPELAEIWPPTLWKCFEGDEERAKHIPRLRERLAMPTPPPSSNWFSSLIDSIVN